MSKKQIRVTSRGPFFQQNIPFTGEFISERRVADILRGVALVNGKASNFPRVNAILNLFNGGHITPGVQKQIVSSFRTRFGPGCPSRQNFVRSIVTRRLIRAQA